MRAYHYTVYIITYIIEIMQMLTWVSEGSSGTGAHVRTAVMTEEVRVERSGPVTELELDLGRTGKVRETGLLVVQRPGTHVQRETAHFPRTPVERSSAHGRQLFQPPLFAPLVLEPHLRKRPKTLCYLFSTRQRIPIIVLMKHYNYSQSKGRTPHARKTHLFCIYIIRKVLYCITVATRTLLHVQDSRVKRLLRRDRECNRCARRIPITRVRSYLKFFRLCNFFFYSHRIWVYIVI